MARQLRGTSFFFFFLVAWVSDYRDVVCARSISLKVNKVSIDHEVETTAIAYYSVLGSYLIVDTAYERCSS